MKKLMLVLILAMFSNFAMADRLDECLADLENYWAQEVGGPIPNHVYNEWVAGCEEDPVVTGNYSFQVKKKVDMTPMGPNVRYYFVNAGDPVTVIEVIINRGNCGNSWITNTAIQNKPVLNYADELEVPVNHCPNVMELTLVTDVGNFVWNF